MDEKRLKDLEEKGRREAESGDYYAQPDFGEDVLELIAEVRRLRAQLEQSEIAALCAHTEVVQDSSARTGLRCRRCLKTVSEFT